MKFEIRFSFRVERSGEAALDQELIKRGFVIEDEAEESEESEEKPTKFGFAK